MTTGYYTFHLVDGRILKLASTSSATPFFAMEHGVPWTGQTVDAQKVILAGPHIVSVEEIRHAEFVR